VRNISVYKNFNNSNSFLKDSNELQPLSYSSQTMPLKSQSEMTINILMCADQNMAVPLTVSLVSAVRTLRNKEKIRAFIFSQGITKSFKHHVEKTFYESPIELFWEEIRNEKLNFWNKKKQTRFPAISFYRIFLDELLPIDVERIVYLDSDTLVCRSISCLYETQLEECIVGAVTDPKHPWFCLMRGCIPARKAGIPDDSPYFNAGVMIIDVNRYRSERIGEKSLSYAKQHAALLDYADQDALNVTLHGRWKPLDPRWNQVSGIFNEHGIMHCQLSNDELLQIRKDPWIIHYTGALPRPWVDSNAHPFAPKWFKIFNLTELSGDILKRSKKNIFAKFIRRLRCAFSTLLHG
jgi:lipopolysaccharide biosynthesis glycosyltransferase